MTCRHCQHDREAHTHYRRGSDCATCDCAHFRRSRAGRSATSVTTLLRRPHTSAERKLAA